MSNLDRCAWPTTIITKEVLSKLRSLTIKLPAFRPTSSSSWLALLDDESLVLPSFFFIELCDLLGDRSVPTLELDQLLVEPLHVDGELIEFVPLFLVELLAFLDLCLESKAMLIEFLGVCL